MAKRKSSMRSIKDLESEGKITFKLNNKDYTFEDGEWRGDFSTVDDSSLLQENKKLVEENNLLKIKVEVLLNMLAEFMSTTKGS